MRQGILGLRALGVARRRGITYILYDQFTTERSAGSVNGTMAEPTGGVRTAEDAQSKLEITGGAVSFNPYVPVVAWANPGMWYSAVARTAGRFLLASVTSGAAPGRQFQIGFSSAQSGQIGVNERFYFASTLNAGVADVFSYGGAIQYSMCIVLRGAGAYFFIKGGAFTYWTLLYFLSTGSVATLYPGYSNLNGIFTSDNIRIPTQTWLPTPLAYDTFTRADGGAGSTETSGPDAQVTPSLAWSNELGTFSVASGEGKFSALDGSGVGVAALPTQATISVLHDAALTRSGGDLGVVVRWTDINNHVRAIHNGTNAQLIKVVGGTPTTLINLAATYGAGRVLRVISDGTAFRLYYHNTLIGAQQTISDAALQTGKVGLYTTDLNNTFDNVTTFARGASGEYAALDVY